MLISTVTSAAPGGKLKRIVAQTPDGGTETVVVGVRDEAPPAAGAAPAAEGPVQQGRLSQFVDAAGKVTLIDTPLSLLIRQADAVTPAQMGGVLKQFNLVQSDSLAQSEGQRIVDALQSKGAGAVMLGVRAGVATFVVIDTVAPTWSFARKATISLLVAAAAAAALWFGIRDEPAMQPEAPAAQSQPAKN